MAVDIKKLFNEQLPAGLAKNPDDAKTIGAKYQMNITGEVSGSSTSPRPGRPASRAPRPPTARSRSRPRTSRS